MLGITFGLKQPDGALPVVAIDGSGPVALAGGRVGDVWRSIDGDPVVEVIDAWLSGTRIRTAGVVLTVRIERAGVGMTIMPVCRASDETIDRGHDHQSGDSAKVSPNVDEEIAGVVGLTCAAETLSATEPTPALSFDPLRAFANELAYIRSKQRPVAKYDAFRDLSIQEN